MKNIIITTILIMIVSCSKHKQENYFESSIVKKIAKLTNIKPPPPVISFTKIYLIDEKKNVLESNIMDLKMIYNTFYKNKFTDFNGFLFEVLNQKMYLPLSYKKYLSRIQTFVIAPTIKHLYENEGIGSLLKKYCFQSDRFFSLNKGTLSLDEINSISYYLFLNQYFRVDDEYNPTINFKKLNLLLPV